jgi:hypothetical protein
MKRIFVSLLAFLYLTSSCEATVYLHYCMGKPAGFSFMPERSANCHRCGMKKSGGGMGCCKDEQKIIKSDKNQKLTDLSVSNPKQKKYVTVFAVYHPYTLSLSAIRFYRYVSTHGPPRSGPVPIYIMNAFLLI